MSLKNTLKRSGFLAALTLLSACTITDLDENGQPIIPPDPNAVVSFESLSLAEIADQLWEPKIVLEATQKFTLWDDLKAQLEAREIVDKANFFVQLSGTIESVELGKHRGVIALKVGEQVINLQVGRIIKGNAIRDASQYVLFDDFKNQIRFAQISRELNKRAMVSTGEPDPHWVGQPATVIAAITVSENTLRDAVPIQVLLEE